MTAAARPAHRVPGKADAVEITVQWVRTSWTKESRSGDAAALRNAAPTGFVLPADPGPVAHVVRTEGHNGYQPREARAELRKVAVALRKADGTLRVPARVDPLYGIPPRPRRPPAVRLRPGQWVRSHPSPGLTGRP